MGGNITVLAPAEWEDILSWRHRDIFINDEAEESDNTISDEDVGLHFAQFIAQALGQQKGPDPWTHTDP